MNKIETDIPFLIIGFLRTDNILKLVNSISEQSDSRIYISIDGPRSIKEKEIQDLLIEKINEKKKVIKNDVFIRHHRKNLGIGCGVVSAIDWFFESVEFGVILEDDLEISGSLIAYVEIVRKILLENNDIWMASGTRVSPIQDRKTITASNYPQIWGWMTSKEKWNEIRKAMLREKKYQIKNLFSYKSNYFLVGARRVFAGKIDTWDIPIAYEMYMNKKKCLLPPVNLITNTGNDNLSTHTTIAEPSVYLPRYLIDEITLPDKIDSIEVEIQNRYLEENVFLMKRRHSLLPIYSFFTDVIRFPKKYRLEKYKSRLKEIPKKKSF